MEPSYFSQLRSVLHLPADATFSSRDLAVALADLFSAAGFRLRGRTAPAWREFEQQAQCQRDTVGILESVARARDPLESARRSPLDLRMRIFRRLDGWWRHRCRTARNEGLPTDIRDVSWRDLAGGRGRFNAQLYIRNTLRSMAAFEKSLATPGRPFKADQEAVLFGLAELFIQISGLDIHPYDLPSSRNSRFIRFAHLALAPYMPKTEGSLNALSRRWERAKGRKANAR